MRSIRIVFLEPVGKPLPELIVVNRSSFHTEEKLLFVGSEGSLDEGILIGTTFVDAVMRELEFLTACIKSSLKLESIVRLDKDWFKWKFRQHQHKSTDTSILIQLVEDDCFLVAGVDINDGILVTGPREARELRCHVFDIHLKVTDGMDIFGMHMDRRLIPWPDVIAIAVDQSMTLEYSMNGHARDRCIQHEPDLFRGIPLGLS